MGAQRGAAAIKRGKGKERAETSSDEELTQASQAQRRKASQNKKNKHEEEESDDDLPTQRKKGSRKKKVDREDGDEEQQTQRGTSEYESLPEETKERIRYAVGRYVLAADRSFVPIKQTDIVAILKKNELPVRVTQDLIDAINRDLVEDFGISLSQLPDADENDPLTMLASQVTQTQGASKSGNKAKKFVLTNTLESRPSSFAEHYEFAHLYSLLMIILVYIHIERGRIKEDRLWSHLKCLDLSPLDTKHPLYGNVRHTIMNTLVDQGFLLKKKDGTDEKAGNPEFEIRRGPRADLEIPEENVLTFAAKVLGVEPDNLVKEYQNRKRKEKLAMDRINARRDAMEA